MISMECTAVINLIPAECQLKVSPRVQSSPRYSPNQTILNFINNGS